MDAMIGQIVKTVDPERIAAMLDTMQERVDEGLDKFEEVGQTISDKISEIDINQLDSFMDLVFNNTRGMFYTIDLVFNNTRSVYCTILVFNNTRSVYCTILVFNNTRGMYCIIDLVLYIVLLI